MTKDRQLQERVLTALEFEPSVDATAIGVTVHDGVVTLRGAVPTYFQKTTAERVVAHVFGVRALANDIEVLPAPDARRSDPAIAEAAANALKWDSAVPAGRVQVALRDGWITLTGQVDWRYQRDAAEYALRRLYGVKGITNSIAVKPRVHTEDVKAKIEGALKRSAELDAQGIHVEAHDGRVVLTGSVRSLSERKQAEWAAWSTAGVNLVDDRLAITG